MEKLFKYGGWFLSLISICGLMVTIMWYGKKIDSNTECLKSVDQELNEIHSTVIDQSNWNTRVGTIIEIQTGIPINIK